MMKRVSSLVVVAALFSLVVLGGCTSEDSSASNGSDGDTPVASDGGEFGLTTVDLKAAVNAQMSEAADAGMYGCCLTMPCSQCMINMGGCPCGENVKDGNPVCHECKGGWAAGGGSVEGVEADDVKVMPRGGM